MCGQYLANIQELNVINQFHSVFWCRHQSTSHDCHDNLKGSFRIFSPCFPSKDPRLLESLRLARIHFPEGIFFSEQNRIAISSCHFLWNPQLKRNRFYFHRMVHLDTNDLFSHSHFFLTRPSGLRAFDVIVAWCSRTQALGSKNHQTWAQLVL